MGKPSPKHQKQTGRNEKNPTNSFAQETKKKQLSSKTKTKRFPQQTEKRKPKHFQNCCKNQLTLHPSGLSLKNVGAVRKEFKFLKKQTNSRLVQGTTNKKRRFPKMNHAKQKTKSAWVASVQGDRVHTPTTATITAAATATDCCNRYWVLLLLLTAATATECCCCCY